LRERRKIRLRADKQQTIQGLNETFSRAKSAILADYKGLSVAEMNSVRDRLRDASVEFRVVKNTLTRIAVKDTEADCLTDYLKGPTAIAFSNDDPVAGAKAIMELAETHPDLEIRAGILGSKLLNEADIKALSKLPGKEILLAQLLRVMNGVATGFVTVLSGNARNLVQVLAAIKEKKENE